MQDRLTQRLAQLQQEAQQTQHALASLEQQRQALLQQLIGQQYAVQVLQGLLDEPEPVPCPACPPMPSYEPVAP